METVIFDLDGTLANIDKRRALATKPDGKIDWDVFFAPENIQLDEPNLPVIKMLKALTDQYCIVIFSGRDDISVDETINWLAFFGIYPDMIKMRRHGSYVPDDKLKKLWLDIEWSKNMRQKMSHNTKGDKNPNWKGGTSFIYCECGKRIGYGHIHCNKCRPRTKNNNPFYGKQHSAETRKKMSTALLVRIHERKTAKNTRCS